MRRVLMLCYYFPPIIASGTTRSAAFVQNLPRLGWKPVVLSVTETMDPWVKIGKPPPPDVEVHRTCEWNLGGACDFLHGACSRAASLAGIDLKTNWLRETFCVPDQQIAWLSTAKGAKLARSCDVVYASCSPFSSALSAVFIKRITGKPAVVDFRDAWTLNPHVRHSTMHAKTIAAKERYVLSKVDKLILNTEGAEKLYRERYPEWSEKLTVIPNGYDALTPITPQHSERFVIMHLGSFYGSRSPELLLDAVSELPEIPIDFIQVGGTFESLERYRGKVSLTVHETLPREQAMEMMSKASLLYLKQGWEAGVTSYIAVAAKTYEYLATGLPILADVPPGDNADIVREYGSRVYTVTSGRKEDLKAAIREAYAARHHAGGISEQFIAEFDRVVLTRRLAEIFDQVAPASRRDVK